MTCWLTKIIFINRYVKLQREGSTAKLHKKPEEIHELVNKDEMQYDYAIPTTITVTRNTYVSMQENPAYNINKTKTTI